LAWLTDVRGYGTVARHDLDHSNRFSRHLGRTRSLGIGPRFPFDAWTGTILDRLPHRPISGEAPLIEHHFNKRRPALPTTADSTKTLPTCQMRTITPVS